LTAAAADRLNDYRVSDEEYRRFRCDGLETDLIPFIANTTLNVFARRMAFRIAAVNGVTALTPDLLAVALSAAENRTAPNSPAGRSRCPHARGGEPVPVLEMHPVRPGWFELRVVKRRPKEYDRLTRPRMELKKLLKIKGNDAHAMAFSRRDIYSHAVSARYAGYMWKPSYKLFAS
jgi:hypothetical protein